MNDTIKLMTGRELLRRIEDERALNKPGLSYVKISIEDYNNINNATPDPSEEKRTMYGFKVVKSLAIPQGDTVFYYKIDLDNKNQQRG